MSDNISDSEMSELLTVLGKKSDTIMAILLTLTKGPIEALSVLAIVASYITTNNLSSEKTDDDTPEDRKRKFLEFYEVLCSTDQPN